MRVYISGAISNDLWHYKEKFKRAHDKLTKEGHIVLDPSLLPLGLDADKYMPICFAMIDASDAIYMLYDCKTSKGASLELQYAKYQKKIVLKEEIE